MPKLTLLGTSYSVPDENHENTHMVLAGEKNQILIDCVGNPIVRLKIAGLKHEELTHILMTHFHPDHVSGVPLLLMGMGLLEREKALDLYGLDHVVEVMERMLQDYRWDTWHHFPVTFHKLPEKELHLMLETEEFRIFTSPVKHFVPTVGVRIEFVKSGRVVAYSCDTAPTPSVVRLAKDADVLIHEAAGASSGHSSPEQAGEQASKAGAKELILIHYPTGDFLDENLSERARTTFNGPVSMAEDFFSLEYD